MQRNGLEISSTADTSPAATLTSDQSLKCEPTICADTPKPISLPESADGLSPSDLPDGTMTDLFGQAHVPASLSAPPARVKRAMTSATFGLRGYLSSPSAALQSSLESRLMTRLDGVGSILFSQTWRRKATPAGRPYYQLAASGRRTLETAFGSWPTPMAGTPAQNGYNAAGNTDSSRKMVELAGWRSPAAQNGDRGGQNGLERVAAGHTLNLQDQALLASWPTPCAQQANGEPEAFLERKRRSIARGSSMGVSLTDLQMVAKLATWPTPRAEDSESSGMRHSRGVADTLTAVSGLANGSHAQTEKPAQLDPDHSRWLMGYTADHLSCAPTETPSFLKSRRNLSVPA